MKKQTLILFILIGIIASSAWAGPQKNFDRADKNKDGFLQKEEYLAMRAGWAVKKGNEPTPEKDAKSFKRKDTNGDGKLTLEEFSGQ